MIIYSNNDLKLIQTCSLYPNSDWTGEAEFVIDETNPDNQDLINKIKEFAPYFDYVLDDDGNLIDVIKTGEREVIESNDPIVNLYNENRTLKAQVQALTESNMFLEECLVEMAEIVYA